MDNQGIRSHYHILARAKRGIYPDGRTKIGKSLSRFRGWLREPYGKDWNTLQDAREAVALPWLLFWLVCPMVNKDSGRILADYEKASNHLERLIKDIAFLADKKPAKEPSLQEYIEAHRK